MKKQIAGIIIICGVLMALMFSLNGCNSIFGETLSGNYVNAGDNTEYLEFYNKNWVTLHKSGKTNIDGSYKISGDILTISFNLGSSYSDMTFKLNKSRDRIYQGDVTFIKGGSSTGDSNAIENSGGIPWWGWALIILFGLGVISAVYKKITGRDLDEDIDKLT